MHSRLMRHIGIGFPVFFLKSGDELVVIWRSWHRHGNRVFDSRRRATPGTIKEQGSGSHPSAPEGAGVTHNTNNRLDCLPRVVGLFRVNRLPQRRFLITQTCG